MATATKKVHAPRSAGHAPRGAPANALEFLTFRDNGGRYHWEIVDSSGESLAQSRIFASQSDAERAARFVYDGAGSAQFEPRVPESAQAVTV